MDATWAIPEGEEWTAKARRVLGLSIDGLRFRPAGGDSPERPAAGILSDAP